MKDAFVDVIAGARPNFVKLAAIVKAMQATQRGVRPIRFRVVHTGQHYDQAMSGAFFEQLGIPEPDCNLGVGSGSHATQTASIMMRYEELLLKAPASLCLVVGDVNSTMACAITAQKLQVPVAHVEGGLRSDDWSMPEEINRRVTDAIANWFFTTSRYANDNLAREGVPSDRVHFVGNTMIDTLLLNLPNAQPPPFWAAEQLADAPYLVLTAHRPSNVDDPARLRSLLEAVARSAGERTIILVAHPRTRAPLDTMSGLPASLRIVPPQTYLHFLFLVQRSRAVVTDSGGLTEEATVLGVPCLTLRENTERPETVHEGTNVLIGDSSEKLATELARALAGQWKPSRVPERWDGRAGERIVKHLQDILYD